MSVISTILGTLLLVGVSLAGFALAESMGFLKKENTAAGDASTENIAPAYVSWHRTPAILLTIGLTALCWLVGMLVYGMRQTPIQTLLDAVFMASMTLLAWIDARRHIVPNKLLLLMLVIWVTGCGLHIILSPAEGLEQVMRAAAGSLIGGVIFLLCYLLSRRQLGGGDVKLAFIMGLYLTGERIMGAVFYGVMLSCIYSIVQLCRKKVGMKDGIPLVPFLYLGTLITMLL